MTDGVIIEIRNLSKKYRHAEDYALQGLDLSVGRGEIFGLLGPNGAGKTTTISIICNQIDATGGEVIVDRYSRHQHEEKIKKIIGVVPQEIALYPTLTAFENLRFFGNMYGLSGRVLEERIENCLLNFGLEQKMHRKVRTFSGGMKRRVNLIAGILHKPRILILDEPTVGIDVQSKTVIIGHLRKLNEEEGITIVYTSHLMEEAENFCTQIGIIDKGKLIAEGNPGEMIRQQPGADSLEDIFLLLTGRSPRD